MPGKVSGGVVFGTLSLKHFCNAENLDATFCASKSCVCVWQVPGAIDFPAGCKSET